MICASLRHSIRTGAALIAGAACIGVAQAQVDALSASDEAKCLRHIGGADKPVYPPEVLARKEGAALNLTMTFDSPDGAPQVAFEPAFLGEVGLQLEQSVRDYAAGLRVPCLQPGKRAMLRQTYAFVPYDTRSVYVERVADADSERRKAMLACITRRAGAPEPTYSTRGRQKEEQGNVLLELTFHSHTEPPVSRVLAAPFQASIRGVALADAANLIMPCNDGNPIRMTRLYQFRLIDAKRVVMRDLSLRDLLASADNLPTGVRFDTQVMGCPFDLRLTYWQPHAPNEVLQFEPDARSGGRWSTGWARRA